MASATPSGTKSYFDRMKTQGETTRSAVLGSTELMVSRVGFGCYRIHEFEPEHREALREALLKGVNLVDVSSNYTDGSAERLVGEVIQELVQGGLLKREEIVVVTKAGYVQGTNLRDAKARVASGSPFPDMVEYQADCWHNISPEFLENQITKSLERLKLETLDVLLLHNPEYYLKSSGTRDVYYQRIETAFRHLESECAKGRIRYYGISSNTLAETESRSDFTSLVKLHELASNVAPDHHFAVIQFPFNIYEAGAVLHLNNKRETVFDYARKAKIGVLTNRPFNAMAKGRLVRLTSFPTHDEVEIKGGLHTILGRAIELENKVPVPGKAPSGLQWAHALRDRLNEFDDLLAWRDALYNQIFPSIRQSLQRLPPTAEAWSREYQAAMQELLGLITRDLENLADKKSLIVADQIQVVAPDLATSPTLSRKVLRIYHSFPQLTSVLVGMRTSAYVKDILGTEAPLSTAQAQEALGRLQRYRS